MKQMIALAFIVLAVGWAVWLTPFVLTMPGRPRAATIDRRARWGIALQGVAYALLWQGPFWLRRFGAWQVAGEILCLALGCLLSWTGARALGRHLRVDAGLSANHTLVRTGPYRVIRHPIYTSMLCVLLATAITVAPWPLFAAALTAFVIGTEIRVRIEDRLLAQRFGDVFERYRAEVRAYIPFVR